MFHWECIFQFIMKVLNWLNTLPLPLFLFHYFLLEERACAISVHGDLHVFHLLALFLTAILSFRGYPLDPLLNLSSIQRLSQGISSGLAEKACSVVCCLFRIDAECSQLSRACSTVGHTFRYETHYVAQESFNGTWILSWKRWLGPRMQGAQHDWPNCSLDPQ